jgi:hypothetical protein
MTESLSGHGPPRASMAASRTWWIVSDIAASNGPQSVAATSCRYTRTHSSRTIGPDRVPLCQRSRWNAES